MLYIILSKASSLGISLTPNRWGISLWVPLAEAIDKIINSNLIQNITLNNYDDDKEVLEVVRDENMNNFEEDGEGVYDPYSDNEEQEERDEGNTQEKIPEPIDNKDVDETGTPILEMTIDEDSIKNKKRKSMTRKQREKKDEMDFTALLAGLPRQIVLNQIVVDIINILTIAVLLSALLLFPILIKATFFSEIGRAHV